MHQHENKLSAVLKVVRTHVLTLPAYLKVDGCCDSQRSSRGHKPQAASGRKDTAVNLATGSLAWPVFKNSLKTYTERIHLKFIHYVYLSCCWKESVRLNKKKKYTHGWLVLICVTSLCRIMFLFSFFCGTHPHSLVTSLSCDLWEVRHPCCFPTTSTFLPQQGCWGLCVAGR